MRLVAPNALLFASQPSAEPETAAVCVLSRHAPGARLLFATPDGAKIAERFFQHGVRAGSVLAAWARGERDKMHERGGADAKSIV